MEKEKLRSDIEEQYKWNLTDIFKSLDEFSISMKKAREILDEAVTYQNRIMETAESFYQYLKLDETLDQYISNLYVYAHLWCDEDSTNEKAVELKIQTEKLIDEASEKLSFSQSEMMRAGYDLAKSYIENNPKLKDYRFKIEKIYRYEKYTLSEQEEKIIAAALTAFGTPDDAFYCLDNSDINLGFITTENGEKVELTNSNYSVYLISENRDIRKQAFEKMYQFWKNHNNTTASLLKGNIKENIFSSKVRGFSSPLEMSLDKDNIPVSLYKSVINIVHQNSAYVHEYMEYRKKKLDLDELHMYDLYVPLVKRFQKEYTFEEAKDIVLSALKPLGDSYINDLSKAFDDRWIDRYPNKGKKSGAYQWGTYGVHPYVLLNYTGTLNDVSTMAHELGHAMHTYYSDKNQTFTYSSYPIFLAEIASTVNEVLLNDYLYKNATSDEEREYYLVDILDTIRTTIYRQTHFAEFEMIMHDKEEQGISLTAAEFNNTYYELNKTYYGPAVTHDEEIKYEWSRIPHFYDSFYVYKYATGLACALYIADGIIKGDQKIKDGYLDFLASGGSDYPLEILKKVGIDFSDTKVLQSAFDIFKEKLDLLKNITN